MVEYFLFLGVIFTAWSLLCFDSGRRHEKWIKREIEGGNRK